MVERKYDWYPAEDPKDWQTVKYDPDWLITLLVLPLTILGR